MMTCFALLAFLAAFLYADVLFSLRNQAGFDSE